MTTITFRTDDGSTIEIDRNVALMSNTVKNLCQDVTDPEQTIIPVPNTNIEVLREVLRDGQNMSVDYDTLDNLYPKIVLANYLEINQLLDLYVGKLIQLMKFDYYELYKMYRFTYKKFDTYRLVSPNETYKTKLIANILLFTQAFDEEKIELIEKINKLFHPDIHYLIYQQIVEHKSIQKIYAGCEGKVPNMAICTDGTSVVFSDNSSTAIILLEPNVDDFDQRDINKIDILSLDCDCIVAIVTKGGEVILNENKIEGNFIDCKVSYDYCLLLDKKGNVWKHENNTKPHDGYYYDYAKIEISPLKKISGLINIVDIAFDSEFDEHHLALDSNGVVWVWDSVTYRLGIDIQDMNNGDVAEFGFSDIEREIISKPRIIPTLPPICRIYCRDRTSVAVDIDGNVWIWGYFNYTKIYKPYKIPSLVGIREVSIGCYHVLALDTNGDVWAFGKNSDGQLGLGDYKDRDIFTAIKIPTLSKIKFKAIACGDHYNLALDVSGRVWIWGLNSVGLLCFNGITHLNHPVRLPLFLNK